MEIVERKSVSKFWNGFLIFLGFWLSPLSPWNDLFTNIPIAYAFGLVFSLLHESFFLPAVIGGYWLSNIAGFILMHYGYVGMKGREYLFKERWKGYMLATSLYTVVVFILIWFEVLPPAQEIITFFD